MSMKPNVFPMKTLQALILACLCWLPAVVYPQGFIDRVLVVVDNVPLTLSEYRVRHRQEAVQGGRLAPFNGEVEPELLTLMIDERLQVLQAEYRGIDVTEQEVDASVELIARQNDMSSTALVSQLERDGITLQEFRTSIREQQMIRKLMDAVANSRVIVSDQEIENYLNAHSELRAADESYEVSHLLIQIQDKTDDRIASERENMHLLRQRIEEGLPFEQAVLEYSDSSSREDGGYLGWRRSDQLPELFLEALRDMDPETDNLSPVLQSDSGLHLLKLHGRGGGGALVDQQQIQHILIIPDQQNTLDEVENLANRVYDQLLAGESFEKLVRLYSMDTQSRDSGGSLGWVNPGSLVPEFEEAAKSLPIGQVSKPVRTRYGYHLIRVLDRRSTDMANEIAANKARQTIFRRKATELYLNWFQSIRQRAFIEYVGIPDATGS